MRASAIRSRFSSRSIRSLHLVGVAEDLLLLIPEPLELPLDFFTGLLGLGGFESRLQLFEPFVEVGLALGQLVETIEHLACFLLLPLALRSIRSGPWRSVALRIDFRRP